MIDQYKLECTISKATGMNGTHKYEKKREKRSLFPSQRKEKIKVEENRDAVKLKRGDATLSPDKRPGQTAHSESSDFITLLSSEGSSKSESLIILQMQMLLNVSCSFAVANPPRFAASSSSSASPRRSGRALAVPPPAHSARAAAPGSRLTPAAASPRTPMAVGEGRAAAVDHADAETVAVASEVRPLLLLLSRPLMLQSSLGPLGCWKITRMPLPASRVWCGAHVAVTQRAQRNDLRFRSLHNLFVILPLASWGIAAISTTAKWTPFTQQFFVIFFFNLSFVFHCACCSVCEKFQNVFNYFPHYVCILQRLR